MTRTFAYFILTGALIELWSEYQQVEQYSAVGYEIVFEWGQAVGDIYVRLRVFSLPGTDVSHMLSRAHFDQIARRAVAEGVMLQTA